VQRQANVIPRIAPILPFAPLSRLILDSPAKSLKRVSETERIVFQIFIDVFFDQDMTVRTSRFREDTQRSQARPEPVHFIVFKSMGLVLCFSAGTASAFSTLNR
jgi:hypothetical protein